MEDLEWKSGSWVGKILVVKSKPTNHRKPLAMKLSRNAVRRKTHAIPALRFEQQRLTSFSGLLLFQVLFGRLDLRRRLRACLATGDGIYDRAVIVLGLVVHLLLGYRQLRDARYYRDDPMVRRLLGLSRLPDVATVSRCLAEAGVESVERVRRLCRELVLERLVVLAPRRLTLDFDGSVIGTGRWAEGTAVGFNRHKKGQRSYYPLFCTLAQTGQVFDLLHRPGNVHDSRGAKDFLLAAIEQIRAVLPAVVLEARLDGAFFSDEIVRTLDELGVEFSVSVPFERFVELKQRIERRHRWRRINADLAYFEDRWKPKSWPSRYRFVFLRTTHRRRSKQPVQLDLFEPVDFDFRYTVVVTNKTVAAGAVARFHHGRGAQEGVFAELKSQGQLDYVPTRTLAGNQLYLLAAILAHNLNRELQMTVRPADRTTTPTRAALWRFEQLDTFRRTLLQRAGRLSRPQGAPTLTISASPAVQDKLLHSLDQLRQAA
jgi:Transposase DDE domain group 1